MANSEANKNTIFGSVKYLNSIRNKDYVEMHVIWTIPNFIELITDEKIEDIDSPIPTELSPGEYKFQFGIKPWPRKKIDIFFSSPTHIFLKSLELKTFTFDKSTWVYDQEQTTIGSQGRQIVEANSWYEFLELPFVGSYLEDGDKICILKNGSLHLRFEFIITIEEEKEEDQFKIPLAQLCNDMEELLLEGMYTDVVIKSAEDKEFRVHKGVLATRSTVLKAHFGHKTTESITNVVQSPLESAVLHEILSFIYTDKSSKVNEIPEKLLAAADYYQLNRLKSLCEEALYKKLTVDNAIETLQLADLHSANTLKKQTLKFIWRNDKQLELITKTAGWANLQSADLLKMICECSRCR